jgi:hypothetical protein
MHKIHSRLSETRRPLGRTLSFRVTLKAGEDLAQSLHVD